MKKLLSSLLGFCLLIGGCLYGVNGCIGIVDHAQKEAADRETQRVAQLTPEQRAAEEAAKTAGQQRDAKARELEERQSRAISVSQDYVREFLKYPDDASFSIWDTPEIRWNVEETTFFVSSKMKAKNDFGAELTHRWATIVTLDGDTWKLVSCAVDDKQVYDQSANYLEESNARKRADAERERQEQLKARRQSEAEQRRADADKKRPGHAAAMLESGRNLAAAGKSDAAKSWFQRVVDTYPETPAADEARSLLAGAGSQSRIWTDRAGKHHVTASLVEFDGKVATLRKSDGKPLKIPVEKLSDDDRDFLTNNAAIQTRGK
jgi:sRNA-binding protein